MPFHLPFITKHPTSPDYPLSKINTKSPSKSTPNKSIAVMSSVYLFLFAVSAFTAQKVTLYRQSKSVSSFEECARLKSSHIPSNDPNTCSTAHGNVFHRQVLGKTTTPTPTPQPSPTPSPTPTPPTSFKVFELTGEELTEVTTIDDANFTGQHPAPVINPTGDIFYLSENTIMRRRSGIEESEEFYTPPEGSSIVSISTPQGSNYLYLTETSPVKNQITDDPETQIRNLVQISTRSRATLILATLNPKPTQAIRHLRAIDNYHLVYLSPCAAKDCPGYIYKLVEDQLQPLIELNPKTHQYLGFAPHLQSIILSTKDPDTGAYLTIDGFNVNTLFASTIFNLKIADLIFTPMWLSPDHTQIALSAQPDEISILDLSLGELVDTQTLEMCKPENPAEIAIWSPAGIYLKCRGNTHTNLYALDPFTTTEITPPEETIINTPSVLGTTTTSTLLYSLPN